MERSESRSRHILVVDDDVLALERVRDRLTQAGFRVSVSDIAANLESRIAALNPDLVLLDVLMPGLGAADIVDLLHAHSADEPPRIALLSPVPPPLLSALIDTTFALTTIHATQDERFLAEVVGVAESTAPGQPLFPDGTPSKPFVSGTHRIGESVGASDAIELPVAASARDRR